MSVLHTINSSPLIKLLIFGCLLLGAIITLMGNPTIHEKVSANVGVSKFFSSGPAATIEQMPWGTVPGKDVVVPGIGRHTSTVIFIHGLRGNAAIAMPFLKTIRPGLMQLDFVLPNSYLIPLEVNEGELMEAWWDVDRLDHPFDAPLPAGGDERRMSESVDRIHNLINAEIASGIPANRIVVAGFSQGCALALLSSLSSEHELGGLVCMSGWLPLTDKTRQTVNGTRHHYQEEHANKMPVFWAHGMMDTTVNYLWGVQTVEHLQRMGFGNIEFHAYPNLVHWIDDQEEVDLQKWLQKTLPMI